jgi:Fe-S cluster assembly ATP-binding protein
VGNSIAELLEKKLHPENSRPIIEQKQSRDKMGLIITHTGYILDYITADKGQVLYDGVLSCTTNPREILKCIGQMGYKECVRCVIEKN